MGRQNIASSWHAYSHTHVCVGTTANTHTHTHKLFFTHWVKLPRGVFLNYDTTKGGHEDSVSLPAALHDLFQVWPKRPNYQTQCGSLVLLIRACANAGPMSNDACQQLRIQLWFYITPCGASVEAGGRLSKTGAPKIAPKLLRILETWPQKWPHKWPHILDPKMAPHFGPPNGPTFWTNFWALVPNNESMGPDRGPEYGPKTGPHILDPQMSHILDPKMAPRFGVNFWFPRQQRKQA